MLMTPLLMKAIQKDNEQCDNGYRDAVNILKKQNELLKKQIENRTQEIVVYRAFVALVMDMKSCEMVIDKEKAFDYIMEQCSKNFNGSGTLK